MAKQALTDLQPATQIPSEMLIEQPSSSEQSKPDFRPRVAILGAGFSGLGMAAELRRRGIEDFLIFEKADDVGGTWRENTYPGVACDVPSHLYSFSFDQNPDWSERFSKGSEIYQYMKQSTERLGLSPMIRFGREVVNARHDGSVWHLKFATGETACADIVVSGLGGLHIPNTPEISGAESFTGPSFHTARWDHEVDLTGKRVAIIGSAASAIQVVPEISGTVASLDIYQRTANWVLPRKNYRYPAFMKALFRHVPGLQNTYRGFIFNLLDLRFPAFKGKDGWMRRQVEREFRKALTAHIDEPDLQKALTPDYPIGCKRILISDDYFSAIAQDHVNIVTDGIEAIDPSGIRTKAGDVRPADVVIYATGFKPFDLMDALDVINADGVSLREAWAERIAAHKTIAVPGFPDFFFLLGPNSALGHNSVVLMIEAQTRYIGELINLMDQQGVNHVHPDQWAAHQYDDRLQAELGSRVWSGGCKSWYLDENGRNYTLYPGSVRQYCRDLRAPDLREYEFEADAP